MPDPRFPDPTQKAAFQGHADRIKRLEEAMTRKPKAAPVASSDSPMTMAYLYSEDNTIIVGNQMRFDTWDVQDTNLPDTSGGVATPVLDVLTEESYFGPAEDGFYGLTVNVSLNFHGTPGGVPEVWLNDTALNSARLAHWYRWQQIPQVQSHDLYYTMGPGFYSPTALTHPAFSVAVRVPGGFGPTPTGSVNAWITRLG